MFVVLLIFSSFLVQFSRSFVTVNNSPVHCSTWEVHSTFSQNEEPTTDIISADISHEERNLRFSGVGRLYTLPSPHSKETKDPPSVATHNHIPIIDRLHASSVLVVGLGGVGSWAAEALCRSGIGSLMLCDLDDVCISNTNRQLHALSSSVGKMKIDVMKERLLQINPECNVTLVHDFVSSDNVESILNRLGPVTACLDAIDGSQAKSSLIAACARRKIPIVTCGGSAGRTDPTKFVCEDLTRVKGDPLLSSCRRNLRKFYGFEEGLSARDENGRFRKKNPRKWNILAVYSKEPQKSLPNGSDSSSLRRCDGALGTACFVTGTSGFVAAGQIVKMIAEDRMLLPRRFGGKRTL